MSKFNTVKFTLPSHWASYLINGNSSGLNDNEVVQIDNFMLKHRFDAALSDVVPVSVNMSVFSFVRPAVYPVS